MSNDEQQLQIAPKTQQQRRSRRLVIGGSMTKTRPKQTSASVNADNQHQHSNSDNDIGSQVDAPEQANDDNNNDPNASTSGAAATTTNATAKPPILPASTNKQNKLRARMVRRSNEPAEEDLRLMKLIKDYPFLYDKTDSAYGKKKTSWETWETISKAMDLPVFTCKERWRNIRAAFMRSIDYYKTQNGPNRSKQYYMNEELSFLRNCVDKQKRAGIAADNDSSSNDADDSEHGGNNFILPAAISNINNNTSISTLPETREAGSTEMISQLKQQQKQQPQLKSLTSEIATTSNGQMVLQNNASTIVSVTTASNLGCNGIALAALPQPPSSLPPMPLTTSTPQIPMQQISLPIPFQLPASSTPKSSSAEQFEAITNSTTDMGTPPSAKRRRYYEYDERSDTFKRVQLQNIFDGWSEQDSDAHFLKSLFLKMRNLSEDQSLRFQCKAINALREVQMPATIVTPKTSTTTTPATTSQQQQQNAGGTSLRLDHLNEEQRAHVQRYIQHITNDATSAATTQRSANLINGSSTDSLLTPIRRLDLTPMVMPLLIKDELLDPGHLSN